MSRIYNFEQTRCKNIFGYFNHCNGYAILKSIDIEDNLSNETRREFTLSCSKCELSKQITLSFGHATKEQYKRERINKCMSELIFENFKVRETAK